MTARFWYFHREGWVRLTVTPGHPLTLEDSHATEEGHASHEVAYTVLGDRLHREEWTDETDCDGRLTTHREMSARLDRLEAWGAADGVLTPLWEEEHDERGRVIDSQRDYNAEAAGY